MVLGPHEGGGQRKDSPCDHEGEFVDIDLNDGKLLQRPTGTSQSQSRGAFFIFIRVCFFEWRPFLYRTLFVHAPKVLLPYP